MATPSGENDSIITFGLELAEETERSVGEIASELGKEGEGAQPAQAAPEQAELQEMRSVAQAAQEREAAERAQEMAQAHELEQSGLER